MSGEDVLALLGEPLSDTYDAPDHTRRMVYYRSAILSLGDSDFILLPGLDITVLLQDNVVVSAHIIDTRLDRMCICERDICPSKWVSPCLPSLPPR